MIYTNHLGIVYGPYGSIGYVQRTTSRKLSFSIRGLLRWVTSLFP
jgi:hypothetical protein